MKLTIFIIAFVIAGYLLQQGYESAAWGLVIVAAWEAILSDWWSALKTRWRLNNVQWRSDLGVIRERPKSLSRSLELAAMYLLAPVLHLLVQPTKAEK